MDRRTNLPDDPAHCHRLLLAAHQASVRLQQQVAELGRVLDETAASYEELRQEHTATLEQLAWYKRWVHGRRRERVVEGEGQQHLFDLMPPGDVESPTVSESDEPRQEIAGHTRRRRRRELDLSRLPHHRHELDLPDEEKTCGCCGRAKDRIGEDITKILEYEPSKLEVHEHVRPKYACRYCKDGVSSPPPPPRPIARGIAGPGLIAQIVVSKFGDHLPLYRLEDIFVRHGIHLARSTLRGGIPIIINACLAGLVFGWCVSAAGLLVRPKQRAKVKKKNNTPPAEAVNSAAGNPDDQADFVANIGHDLKTYLNPIIGFTSVLLLEKTNLNSDQVHQLDLVYRSARQLLERIDAMVEFQRLIAGAKVDPVDWVSVRELFLEVSQTFAEAAAQQGTSINVEAVPARLRTSRLMLARVFKELVSNAIKFSEAGTVTLKAERIKHPDPQKVRLRFCVTDSGSGLSPQLLTVLRAGFGAAPDSAGQSFAGLGLGLALAREAAKRLGGWLEVDSSPDQGSTFSLIVDLLADDLENEAG